MPSIVKNGVKYPGGATGASITITQSSGGTDYTCAYSQVGKTVTVTGTMVGTGSSTSVNWYSALPDPLASFPVFIYLSTTSEFVPCLFTSNGIATNESLDGVGTFAFSYVVPTITS